MQTTNMGPIVNTEVILQATAELQEQVKKELEISDPEAVESAEADLKQFYEDTR